VTIDSERQDVESVAREGDHKRFWLEKCVRKETGRIEGLTAVGMVDFSLVESVGLNEHD
jgi:hypothetical protein